MIFRKTLYALNVNFPNSRGGERINTTSKIQTLRKLDILSKMIEDIRKEVASW